MTYGNWIIVAICSAAAFMVLHMFYIAQNRKRPVVADVQWRFWEKLLYAGLLFSVVGSAGTAFWAMFTEGHLSGWLLFAHLGVSPALAVVLPLLAITWAHSCRLFQTSPLPDTQGTTPRFTRLTRFTFWLIMLAGLVTLASIVASMLFVPAEYQKLVITIHAYSALALVALIIIHIYSLAMARAT